MSFPDFIRALRGSQRYMGALDKDVVVRHSLEQTHRMLFETERNAVLNLNEQYFIEREESKTYRPYGKIKPLVDNVVSGYTSDPLMCGFQTYYYPPFPPSTASGAEGYPSINFFDFFTPTALTTTHNYTEPNSYKDNWLVYASYVSGNIDKSMRYYANKDTNQYINFNSRDGIAFHVRLVKINGKSALQCVCSAEHGLLENEYIEIQDSGSINTVNTNHITTINGGNQVPIYSFGDEMVGSEKKIFNILLRSDVNNPNTIIGGDCGVFKRLSDPSNYNETLSRYYVHQHTILTDLDESVVDRTAFEFGIYNKRFRYYREDHSPPFGIGHEVVKNQSSSFLWNFSKDIDVTKLKDNYNRPILDLYATILVGNQTNIWQKKKVEKKIIRGVPTLVAVAGYGMGWDWNFVPSGQTLDGYPNNFFSNLSTPDEIPKKDDTFAGAFVEYNEFELKERIISEVHHALHFNEDIFHDGKRREIIDGYFYQPHYRIPIRKIANSISTYPDYRFVPSYATFSISEQIWRWRNVLNIGFFDSDKNGVNYPFVNGAHYPYTNIDFFIKPWLVDKPFISDGIIEPLDVDDCE